MLLHYVGGVTPLSIILQAIEFGCNVSLVGYEHFLLIVSAKLLYMCRFFKYGPIFYLEAWLFSTIGNEALLGHSIRFLAGLLRL